jgi:Tfp pilus assembly protein FimT
MGHQSLLAGDKGSRLESSSRELMAAARQARAEALYNMISGLVRRLHSIVGILG